MFSLYNIAEKLFQWNVDLKTNYNFLAFKLKHVCFNFSFFQLFKKIYGVRFLSTLQTIYIIILVICHLKTHTDRPQVDPEMF